MDKKREAFHRKVAEKLIEQLEQGVAPWQKPWQSTEFLPYNASTGQRYRGVNILQLMSEGRSDARWMTYNQAQAVGAQVKKGEKGTVVQYWKYEEERVKRDEQGNPLKDKDGKSIKETIRFQHGRVFQAVVFNAEQIEGLPPPPPKPELSWNPLERAEQILAASNATIKHAPGNRAFYRPSDDSITLPEKAQFPSADGYYATALHELGHWTGHESRLARDLKHPFGSTAYAKEELRAEIASMMLGQELGIGHDPSQHASYVGSWIKVLKDDPQEIYRAASDAEKIQSFVLALEHKQELTQEQEQQQEAEPVQTEQQEQYEAQQQGVEPPPAALQQDTQQETEAEQVQPAGESETAALQAGSQDQAAKHAADTLNTLIQEYGWQRREVFGRPLAVEQTFFVGDRTREIVRVSDGTEVIRAEFDSDLQNVTLKQNFRNIAFFVIEKWDGTAQKPQELAEQIQRRTAQYADEKLIENGHEANYQNALAEKSPSAQDGQHAQSEPAAKQPQTQGAPVPKTWRYQACEVFDEEMAKRIGDPNYDKAQELAHELNEYGEMSFMPSPREQAILAERKTDIEEAEQWIQENVLSNPVVKERMYEFVRDFHRDSGDASQDKETHDYIQEMRAKRHGRHQQVTPDDIQKQEQQKPLQPKAQVSLAERPFELPVPEAVQQDNDTRLARLLATHSENVEEYIRETAQAIRQSDEQRQSIYQKKFGLPLDWTGELRIVGEIRGENSVYARKGDTKPGEDAWQFVTADRNRTEVEVLAEQILLINALSVSNPYDQAAALASIERERVARNPYATDAERVQAKEREDYDRFLAKQYEAQQQSTENTPTTLQREAPLPHAEETRETAAIQEEQPIAEPPAQDRQDNASRLEKLLAAYPEETAGRLRQTAYALQKDGLDSLPVFGQTLPPDWTGEVNVLPSVRDIEDGQIVPAEQTGRAPEGYAVYVKRGEVKAGESEWQPIVACKTLEQAEIRAEQLQLLDAMMTQNPAEQAAKLTQIEQAQRARQGAAHMAKSEGQAPRQAEAERHYLKTDWKDREEVKALGAKWDAQEKLWYVPQGMDAAPFAKWPRTTAQQAKAEKTETLQKTEQRSAPPRKTTREASAERQYLTVPIEQKDEAKALGARWDAEEKLWYATAQADMGKLAKFLPGNIQVQQEMSIRVQDEFAAAMRSIGLVVEKGHPIMDSKPHRVPVEGGKKGATDGFYVGHLNGKPAGHISNNRTGAHITWKSQATVLTDEQKAKVIAESAQERARRAAERSEMHEQAAERVNKQLQGLQPVSKGHPTPYLQAKGIAATEGVMTDKNGKTTFIPAYDASGKQWTTQYVQEDGNKRFAKGGKLEGSFHPVGGMEALKSAPVLVIAEGYATAASLAEGLGHATVAAFTASNLHDVAQALHAKYPNKPIVIAGDDDKQQETQNGRNPGREKAIAAAKAVDGSAVFPIFAPGEQQGNPKGFSDFNDLDKKSALGRDGLERQIKSAVLQEQRHHQQRREQHQKLAAKQEEGMKI